MDVKYIHWSKTWIFYLCTCMCIASYQLPIAITLKLLYAFIHNITWGHNYLQPWEFHEVSHKAIRASYLLALIVIDCGTDVQSGCLTIWNEVQIFQPFIMWLDSEKSQLPHALKEYWFNLCKILHLKKENRCIYATAYNSSWFYSYS